MTNTLLAKEKLNKLANDIEKFADKYDYLVDNTSVLDLLQGGCVETIIEYLASYSLAPRKIRNLADNLAQRVIDLYY